MRLNSWTPRPMWEYRTYWPETPQGLEEEVLESLKKVEDLNQGEHVNQSDTRRLVTWGNYAWVTTWAGWQKPRYTWRRWRTVAGSLPVPPAIECSVLKWTMRKNGGLC